MPVSTARRNNITNAVSLEILCAMLRSLLRPRLTSILEQNRLRANRSGEGFCGAHMTPLCPPALIRTGSKNRPTDEVVPPSHP
jgi:hypothetical protein